MDVTTAIVGFLLLCIAFPTLVRRKTHYYAAFFCMIAVILLNGLNDMIHTDHFALFVGFFTALLQIVALVSLLLASGGLSAKELAGEMREAVDEIRHGPNSTTPIIPITGQMPAPKRPVVYRDAPGAGPAPKTGEQDFRDGPVVYKIDQTGEDNSQIPLE